jgi:hypothetical protein
VEVAMSGQTAATPGVAGAARSADSWTGLGQLVSCAQEAVVQVVPVLLTPQLLNPLTWADLALQATRRSAAGLRMLADGSALLALEELGSKGQVFCLVLNVNEILGVPSAPPFPLYELLAKAYALEPFPALWAVEGLGRAYGDSFFAQGITPSGILTGPEAAALPPKSLLMMHAGIGLSFAKTRLDALPRGAPFAELRATVADVVHLCRTNSRPGDLGAAYESIGLVTHEFHSDLTAAVDSALREVAPEVVDYYWHGVGRAIYFSPINFLPCSDWEMFESARRMAPDERARLNAVAGLAWAYTLVSQRQPTITADLLVGPHGTQLLADGAFTNGIASSAMMRFDTTPGAHLNEPFLGYRPASPQVAALWDQLVRIPGETALTDYYPVLREKDRLGDIFCYRDLAAFVAGLEAV